MFDGFALCNKVRAKEQSLRQRGGQIKNRICQKIYHQKAAYVDSGAERMNGLYKAGDADSDRSGSPAFCRDLRERTDRTDKQMQQLFTVYQLHRRGV